MISVLNRRLDVGEGRERVLKSRVELLQGRLAQVLFERITWNTNFCVTRCTSHVTRQVFGGEAPMPWEEIEVVSAAWCVSSLTLIIVHAVQRFIEAK